MMQTTVLEDGIGRRLTCISRKLIPDVPSAKTRQESMAVPLEHRFEIDLVEYDHQQVGSLTQRADACWMGSCHLLPTGTFDNNSTGTYTTPRRLICDRIANLEKCSCQEDQSDCVDGCLFTPSGAIWVKIHKTATTDEGTPSYDGNQDAIVNFNDKHLFCWSLCREYWSTLAVSVV